MFQFLIGRLKTRLGIDVTCFANMFQFLIGRLKTLSLTILHEPDATFQFLIGRLKTDMALAYMYSKYQVSIPYR